MSRVLNREDAALVIIDVQERLAPAMDNELREQSWRNIAIAVETAGTLKLPILLTEQYPKGLGRTIPSILKALEGKAYETTEKVAFSCARSESFLAALVKTERRQVLLAGMETHICVYQTAIDLVNAGYEVFVAGDAVSSRRLGDHHLGIEAMRDAGVRVLPTEAAIFQLLKVAGTPEFKKISSLLR